MMNLSQAWKEQDSARYIIREINSLNGELREHFRNCEQRKQLLKRVCWNGWMDGWIQKIT